MRQDKIQTSSYDDPKNEEKKQVIDWDLLSNFMIAMLVIVNPVEKIPLWVAVTSSEKKSFEWLLGLLVISSCALILLIFLWFGREILLALHVDLASFKIGGGLILLRFGFSMMQGTAVNVESPGDGTSENLKERVFQRYQQIFIPIGVPVIAGPGAITTVIIYGHQSDTALTTIFFAIVRPIKEFNGSFLYENYFCS